MSKETHDILQLQRSPESPELKYSVQSWPLTSCMSEHEWESLPSERKKWLLNVSHNIDKHFASGTLPPGDPDSNWSQGEKQAFHSLFTDCQSRGVDPRRHWPLLSIALPKKTGMKSGGRLEFNIFHHPLFERSEESGL